MLRMRTFLAAVVVGVLAARGADARAPKDDKADADAGPALHELTAVAHLSYAPDGKSLLVEYHVPSNFQGASTIGVWDVETGKFRVSMEKAPEHCEQIAWSPDGAKAAAISAGGRQLKVWDATTGKPLQEFELPPWKQFIPGAPFLAFSADGNVLTSVLGQKIMRAKIGGEVKVLPDEPGFWSRETVAFAPAADLLVFASNPPAGKKDGSKLQVYDLSKPGAPQTIPLTARVASIAFNGDGKTLAVAYDGGVTAPGNIELWDASAWKAASTLPQDKRKEFWCYRRVFFSADGKLLAGTPSYGHISQTVVEFLDLEGKVTREISSPQLLNDVVFSPDGKTAAVVVGNKPILFLDPTTGKDKEP